MALKTKEKTGKSQKRKGAAEKKGLISTKTYTGLRSERLAQRGGNRLVIKKGQTKTVQFLDTPATMVDYECHIWSEGPQKWFFVPCLDSENPDNCPLCQDEDEDVSKTSYRACANVYSFEDKSVLVFEGGQEIFEKIERKFKRKTKSFLKRTWEISQVDSKRTYWDIDMGDEEAIDPRPLEKKKHDLKEFIRKNAERFFGDKKNTAKKTSKSALDDDDDYEEDEDTFTSRDLKKMSAKQLAKAAKKVGVKPHSSNDKLTIKRILKAQAED